MEDTMIKKLDAIIISLHKDEGGQGMAEYGLIVALVAVICIVGFQLLGKSIGTKIEHVGEIINN